MLEVTVQDKFLQGGEALQVVSILFLSHYHCLYAVIHCTAMHPAAVHPTTARSTAEHCTLAAVHSTALHGTFSVASDSASAVQFLAPGHVPQTGYGSVQYHQGYHCRLSLRPLFRAAQRDQRQDEKPVEYCTLRGKRREGQAGHTWSCLWSTVKDAARRKRIRNGHTSLTSKMSRLAKRLVAICVNCK